MTKRRGSVKGQRPLFPKGDQHVFVALDVETTGLYPERDHIVQIGLVTANHELQVEWEGAVLLDPGCEIPRSTTMIHGISTRDVVGALEFRDVVDWVSEIIAHRIIIGHNLPFDLGFLASEYARIDQEMVEFGECVDTLEIARRELPHQPSYALTKLSRSLGIRLERPHDACFDAAVALELYRYLKRL